MTNFIRKHYLLVAALSFFLLIDVTFFFSQLPSVLSITPLLTFLEIYLIFFLLVAIVVVFKKFRFLLIFVWIFFVVLSGICIDFRLNNIQKNTEGRIASYVSGDLEFPSDIFESKGGFIPNKSCSVDGVVLLAEGRRLDFLITCATSGKWLIYTLMERGEIKKGYVSSR
jgi:hypothetical protein